MDVIKLLEYLQEIIETGGKIPMTGKVVIDKSETMKTIDQIINCMPEQFRKAQWILEEKERILSEAIKEAELMKKENWDMLRRQIENHNITKEAQVMAEQLIASAQKDAKAMRLGARDYAGEILSQLEMEVDRKGDEMLSLLKRDVEGFVASIQSDVSSTTSTIRNNIKELKSMK
jgi:vacuolar-type H+-ATPase subunit H